MKKLLQLSFIPRSTDFALLVLRLWIGVTLLLNHGWGKAMNFSQTEHMFGSGGMDPLGLGGTTAAVLVVFAEVVAAAALAVGFATRLAALVITIELGMAFISFHHHAFSGPRSGELAFMYLAGTVTIFLAGGGRFVLCKSTNDVSA
jgi:putative oxidoreductase